MYLILSVRVVLYCFWRWIVREMKFRWINPLPSYSSEEDLLSRGLRCACGHNYHNNNNHNSP